MREYLQSLREAGGVVNTSIAIAAATGKGKAKVTVDDLASLKRQFLLDIRGIVEMEEIPQDLIINWDQTAVNYVSVSNWTMAKEGTHKVAISGVDDK